MEITEHTSPDRVSLWQKVARKLVVLFNPMTMVVLMSLFVMCGWASPLNFPPQLSTFVVLTVAFMVIGIPLACYGLMHLLGIGGKDESGERRRRRLMFLVVALCCAGCGRIYSGVIVLFLMRKVLYAASLLTVVLWLFELIFPLSKTSFGSGALLAMMWMLLYVGNLALLVPFGIMVIVAGLLATLHIYLFHTPLWRQMLSLLLGFAFGAVIFIMV
ncbi:MAG: hypothetical protein J6R10_03650 [Tidjanibacter sp.]|nr:hypothetical protein [Tidjanibacter sp.]